MNQLRLTQRQATAQRLDMREFIPERLAQMSLEQIAALRLWVGRQNKPAGELFELSGEPCERLCIVPKAGNLDFIGAGMHRGELTVAGDAGDGVGQGMHGGLLLVEGNTGDEAGTGLAGGRLRIDGHTGERLGGPSTGATRGMSGGQIQVIGNAGDRVGERMRRGLILVQGDAGSYCGVNMIAGSIAVQGRVGAMAGSGMRRGTLLLSREPAELPSTFNDNGVHDELSFLRLLFRELATLTDLGPWAESGATSIRRYLGDIGDGGMGEIVWPATDGDTSALPSTGHGL
ncbi:MAG: formylmethanofuran dehydrogenase subunit C [Thiohalocapsa sp.]